MCGGHEPAVGLAASTGAAMVSPLAWLRQVDPGLFALRRATRTAVVMPAGGGTGREAVSAARNPRRHAPERDDHRERPSASMKSVVRPDLDAPEPCLPICLTVPGNNAAPSVV